MNAGDSDIDAIVYVWNSGTFVEHQRLPVPGDEDAEFFRIGERAFLATASIRTGHGRKRAALTGANPIRSWLRRRR